MKKSHALALPLAIVLAGLTACKRSSFQGTTNTYYHDNGSEPEYLDPGYIHDNKSRDIAVNLFEGLATYHPRNLEPLPGVAERWAISPDGRTYTFFLRNNARWTDGKPVVAGDFVYAWRRAVDPKTASRAATHMYPVKNAQAINQGKIKVVNALGVRADGDQKLIVTLEAPFPPFMELVPDPTFMPVRKDIIEKHGDAWTRVENIVSNGPFKLAEWAPHKHLILKKDPSYWDAATVRLDTIVYTPTEDHSTAVKLFEARQIDYMEQIPINQVDRYKNWREYGNSEQFAVYYYWINCQHPILKDVRVRQALSLAIDRNVLANQYLKGLKHPSDKGVVPPGVIGFDYQPYVEFNPEKARKLLAEAGYADPSKLPVFTISYNTNEDHKLIAEVIQQMLRSNLGIQTTIHNMEWKVYLKQLQKHEFEIGRMGAIGEYVYPSVILEGFVTGVDSNFGAYSNPAYDKLWNEALTAADPKHRMNLYAQMDKIIMHDLPVIPLYYYKMTTLLQPWVRGRYLNVLLIPPAKWIWLTPRDRTDRGWDTVLEYTRIPIPKAA